jgi:hypothetical protein
VRTLRLGSAINTPVDDDGSYHVMAQPQPRLDSYVQVVKVKITVISDPVYYYTAPI